MKKSLILIISIFLIFFCVSDTWAFSLFSTGTEEEIAIGQRISQSIERQMPVCRNLEYEKRLIRVGYRLVKVCDRQDLEYKFTIIDKEELNAFTTFGGYLYINKGAMDKAKTDDELAAIVAHEIGHVAARHLTKRLEQDRMFSLGFFALDAFVLRKHKSGRDIYTAVNVAYDIIQRGYSREDELEADRLGVRYCYYAGYNPIAAVSMLEKLRLEKRRQGPEALFENIDILRTHPYIDDRIKAIVSEVAKIKAGEAFEKHSQSKKPSR